MLRKLMIALAIATAGVSFAATDALAWGHGFHGGGFHGGGFHGHFHGGGFYGPGFYGPGFGFYGYGYPYGDFPYSSYLYEDDAEPACYRVIRRVHTRHGWRTRRVLVCS